MKCPAEIYTALPGRIKAFQSNSEQQSGLGDQRNMHK